MTFSTTNCRSARHIKIESTVLLLLCLSRNGFIRLFITNQSLLSVQLEQKSLESQNMQDIHNRCVLCQGIGVPKDVEELLYMYIYIE